MKMFCFILKCVHETGKIKKGLVEKEFLTRLFIKPGTKGWRTEWEECREREECSPGFPGM